MCTTKYSRSPWRDSYTIHKFILVGLTVAEKCQITLTIFLILSTVTTAPTLTLSVVEFPGETFLPIGFNVTIVCRSNASKEDYGSPYYGQPYLMQYYFNEDPWFIKECGGGGDRIDSEKSKVCNFYIQNASKSDSGSYTCWAHNQWHCTEASLKLEFKSKLFNLKCFRYGYCNQGHCYHLYYYYRHH